MEKLLPLKNRYIAQRNRYVVWKDDGWLDPSSRHWHVTGVKNDSWYHEVSFTTWQDAMDFVNTTLKNMW